MLIVEAEKDTEYFNNIAQKAYSFLKLEGRGAIELLFVSPQEMKELNASERGKNEVTDVLSFPLLITSAANSKMKPLTKENYPFEYDEELEAVSVGSIVVCEERVKEQAKEYGHSLERERAYLFVHGLLHLLGYAHDDEDNKKIMRKAEEAILKT